MDKQSKLADNLLNNSAGFDPWYFIAGLLIEVGIDDPYPELLETAVKEGRVAMVAYQTIKALELLPKGWSIDCDENGVLELVDDYDPASSDTGYRIWRGDWQDIANVLLQLKRAGELPETEQEF